MPKHSCPVKIFLSESRTSVIIPLLVQNIWWITFDETYVTGTSRRAGVPRDGLDGTTIVRMRRVPLRYPPALWNVHQATLDGEPRTNNKCDGWKNRFTHLVG